MPQIKDARMVVLLAVLIAPAVAGVAAAVPSTPISAEITDVVHAIDANNNAAKKAGSSLAFLVVCINAA